MNLTSHTSIGEARMRAPRLSRLALPLLLLALLAFAASASAAPIWNVESEALPTAFQPSDGAGNDAYHITLENIGSSTSSGPITLVDHLPAGITTSPAVKERSTDNGEDERGWSCPGIAAGQSVVECTVSYPRPPEGIESVTSTYDQAALTESAAEVAPLEIPVAVASGISETATNTVTVSGGGGLAATVSPANSVGSSTLTFGSSFLHFRAVGPNGESFTQAGGHPWALSTHFQFVQEITDNAEKVAGIADVNAVAGEEAKTIVAELPLGLIGDPQATPRCSEREFYEPAPGLGGGTNRSECPANTRVGVAALEATTVLTGYQLYNLSPTFGHAAEFGFHFEGAPIVFFGDVVRSTRGYVLRITAPTPQAEIRAIGLTFFGDPAAAFETGEKESPFLTTPVDCGASEEERALNLHTDTWNDPGLGDPFNADFADPAWVPSSAILTPMEGCGSLRFAPSLSFGPSSTAEGGTSQADSPSGYNVNLQVPQTETYRELATPELKTTTVVFPEGVSFSPSAANGLQACSDAQIALESNEPGFCPLASQIGSAKVTTPLLESPLEGELFVGEPECSPCTAADASEGHLFRVFLQVHSQALGVTVKLPGTVRANPSTGRLTAEFAALPQLPYSDVELHLNAGPRAPLANPQTCGTFTPSSLLEPWSAPETPSEVSESPFSISGCGSSLPFNPTFAAGTAASTAGGYSPFSVTFSRNDGEQDLGAIAVTTPPGLLGKIAGIPQCPEAQANAGSCSSESQIGTTTVSAGPGADPYTITGGRLYLTGPYNGRPFGLSIVVPAVAGPFNLGNVVVRASIAVNPATSALTITTTPLPQIVDGVPIRLRSVTAEVNRPAFMLNATNCSEQAISATITGEHAIGSSEAAKSSVASSAYAASGCANLPFKPKLTAVTAGHASKAGGASLDVKITSAGLGQANIAKVDLQLPTALPSRLSTLQKACLAAVFSANPAACEEDAVIGKATIHTPILNGPLTGPAYLVSHGGAAFPDVEFVLQGEGVTLILDGKTDIKNGITYSRFESTPDAPFTTFETELPTGPHSILGAYVKKTPYDLCGTNLQMPTILTGQNGAVIEQTTAIAVSGCKVAKPLTRVQKLTAALKTCKKHKQKAKRATCEKQARKKYGPLKTTKKATSKASHAKGRK